MTIVHKKLMMVNFILVNETPMYFEPIVDRIGFDYEELEKTIISVTHVEEAVRALSDTALNIVITESVIHTENDLLREKKPLGLRSMELARLVKEHNPNNKIILSTVEGFDAKEEAFDYYNKGLESNSFDKLFKKIDEFVKIQRAA